MNRLSDITIGPTKFKNKSQAVIYFQNLLKKYAVGERINNPEHHKHLVGLLELPAGKDRTRGTGVSHFSVNPGKTHPDKKSFYVHRTDDTVSQLGFTTILQDFEKLNKINEHKVQVPLDASLGKRALIRKALTKVMSGFALEGYTEEQRLEQCVLIDQMLRLELPAHWQPVLEQVARDEQQAKDPVYQDYLRKKALAEKAQRDLEEAEQRIQNLAIAA